MSDTSLEVASNNPLLSQGKWTSQDVPKGGWNCIILEDLGEPQQVCEMCDLQTIRYVHHMEHSHYHQVIKVGRVCAGYMEGDERTAKDRENMLTSRASKRKRWVVSSSWKDDPYGPRKKSGKFWVVVKKWDREWKTEIYDYFLTPVYKSDVAFETVEEAKSHGFDRLYPSKIMLNSSKQ